MVQNEHEITSKSTVWNKNVQFGGKETHLYFVGGAFALMYANIRSINIQMDRPVRRHPEAPQKGDLSLILIDYQYMYIHE